MKAIRTHYLSATNTKPSRVVASDNDDNKVTVDMCLYDSFEDASVAAVDLLVRKMDWRGDLVHGGFGEDLFFVFV